MDSNNSLRRLSRAIAERYGRKAATLPVFACELRYRLGSYHRFFHIDWSKVSRLVFVCSGNICRSAYGEWRARSSGIKSISAGIAAKSGDSANETAVAVAAKRGVDLRSHKTTPFCNVTMNPADLVLVMEPAQALRVETFVRLAGAQLSLLGLWSQPRRVFLADPYGLCAEYFDTCFALIDSAIWKITNNVARYYDR